MEANGGFDGREGCKEYHCCDVMTKDLSVGSLEQNLMDFIQNSI
jgi:hypothetical protein